MKNDHGTQAPSDADVQRYAEAILAHFNASPHGGSWRLAHNDAARAVLAERDKDVDAATAPLRAEIERLTAQVDGWHPGSAVGALRMMRAEAERDALVAALDAVRALADEWEKTPVKDDVDDYSAADVTEAVTAETLNYCGGQLLAILDGPSPAAQPATPDGESPCRCGHAKAEHRAPDGDTYCRRCSCAHYLPTVADMMRDEAAVGRLLAAVEKPAAQEATRPDGCVTHQAFWPIGAKVCDAISSGGVVGGGPCVAGEHPAQERTTPPAEPTSGGE